MIYTIKNVCVEEPGLPYEDGAKTIFLYTKGTAGNPSKDLAALACYMEHSTAENAKSTGLARLHEMVIGVKSDREVGVAYMKAVEIEKYIREKSMAEGMAAGMAKAVLTLLTTKGTPPPQLESAINAQTDINVLN